MDRPALCQNIAPKSVEQFCRAASNLTQTYNTDCLALELPADQSVLGLTIAAPAFYFAHIACQGQNHAEYQL